MSDYIKVYTSDSEPNEVFLLEDGNVFFYVSEVDKYALKGKHVIFGGTEIILNNLVDVKTKRGQTAKSANQRASEFMKESIMPVDSLNRALAES